MPEPTKAPTRCIARALATAAGSALLLAAAAANAAADNPAGISWMPVGAMEVARTETTVAQFRRFVSATGRVTRAERAGGGQVYEAGWVVKPGWTWQRPFGVPAADDEPAVHIAFDEAQAFCRWAGGRLPRDAEWVAAAYTEQRAAPPAPFERGKTYPYPTGERPEGAICLDDCGAAATALAVRHGAALWRGAGHAPAGASRPGVNGLHEMGGNAWEWVDEPPADADAAARSASPKRTRGGSWWYGAAQMTAGHLQDKPADTTVVYIGARCVRDRR